MEESQSEEVSSLLRSGEDGTSVKSPSEGTKCEIDNLVIGNSDEAPSFDEAETGKDAVMANTSITSESASVDGTHNRTLTTVSENADNLGPGEMEGDIEIEPTVTNGGETLKLIEMLRSDEVSDRFVAMAQLKVIAVGLGEQRTIKELIPFLTESTDDEDEVLVVMAEHIGELIDHIGGKENYRLLLPPLELLLMVGEWLEQIDFTCAYELLSLLNALFLPLVIIMFQRKRRCEKRLSRLLNLWRIICHCQPSVRPILQCFSS
jgi:hypothetical protein